MLVRFRKRGRLAGIFVAAGCVALGSSVEAAELRIVMQTNTPSPVEGYRYTDVGYVALGDTGDLAYVSRIRKDNDEKRTLFRETAGKVVAVAVPGTPKPGGGNWAPLDVSPLVFHGQWLTFATKELTGATAVWVRGTLANSTEPLLVEGAADGATTIGPIAKFDANGNRVLIAQTNNVVYGVHPTNGRTRLTVRDEEVPGAPGFFATSFGDVFVDDANRYTFSVIGVGATGSNFVLHGQAGSLQPLQWFKDNPAITLEGVGLKGSLVARGYVAGTQVTGVFVGAPEGALTEAFRWGDGLTVAGKAIATVERTRAISATSLAFLGREPGGTSHLMLYEAGAVRELAGPGIDAPGTGQKFTGVRDFGVNSKGQVVFRGNFEKESTTGIFLYTPGKGIEYIAGRGSKVGAIDIGSVGEIDNGSLDETGRVGFVAMHVSQPITALISTGSPGVVQPDGADLELTAEQIEGEIVFHIKNLGPAEATAGTLTISRLALSLAPGIQVASCNEVLGDTVCDVFQGALKLAPGRTTDVRFLPPPNAGTRVDGNLYGVSDKNTANNAASVTYEPKGLAPDPVGDAADGSCSLVHPSSQRSAIGGFLLGLVAFLGLRRRTASRR